MSNRRFVAVAHHLEDRSKACSIVYGLETSLPFLLFMLLGLFRGGPYELQLYPIDAGHPLQQLHLPCIYMYIYIYIYMTIYILLKSARSADFA